MNHPTRLRTGHLSEAFGLTTTAPRLSWTPPDGTLRQSAYQLTASNGWDTGRVDSGAHQFVPYDGPALVSRDRFDWRVRTWDPTLDGAEIASGWSEPMAVELGLLHPTDWTARWIGPVEPVIPAPGERPGYALHREFTLDSTPESARAYATAHGIYELFINGQRVGDQQLTPGSTSYHSTLQVQAYDVAALLRAGTNSVRAVLTDGWFRGSFGFTRDADMYGTQTAFLAQLEMESGGQRTVIGTDASWLVSTTEIVSADLMAGQRVDFRAAGAATGPAVLREGSFGTLTGPVAPPTRIVEELMPASITRLGNGNRIVDLGRNINGWVRLSRLGAAGAQVTLVYGEALDADGEVTQDHLRPIDFKNPGQFLAAGQVDSVISAGDPGEVFEPRHTAHGFQYVSVRGLTEDLTPADIVGCMVQTDLERLGRSAAATTGSTACTTLWNGVSATTPARSLPTARNGKRPAGPATGSCLCLRRPTSSTSPDFRRSGSGTYGPINGTAGSSSTSRRRPVRRSPALISWPSRTGRQGGEMQ